MTAGYYYPGGYVSLQDGNHMKFNTMIADHLGNTRMVLSQTNYDSQHQVEQRTNYYAFGGLLTDGAIGADIQTHKFIGKELDTMHGLNMYDFGARQLDPTTGLFTSMDPLCEKYYNISPYSYCAGNPIRYVDPDGRDVWDINQCGEIIKTTRTNKYDQINIVRIQDDGTNELVIGKGNQKQTLTFEYGTITHSVGKTKQGVDYDIFKINGDENATKIFSLLAMNSSVEYSLCRTGQAIIGDNYITTSRDEGGQTGHHHEAGMGNLFSSKLYKLGPREFIHSHPDNTWRPSTRDINQALLYQDYCPSFSLFLPVYGNGPLLIPYNGNSNRDTDFLEYEKEFNNLINK